MGPLVPVVLCGGPGSRLWPLSRRVQPKQLLPLTGTHSLLQATLQRLDGLDAATPWVVCGAELRFAVREQIEDLGLDARVLVEPVGRNTAPAVALAAHLVEDDPLLLVLPSDHHLAHVDAFQDAVRAGVPLAEQGHLVVFGVQPTRPETGYGYVRCGPVVPGGYVVEAFTEKPDAATAAAWVADGRHRWNSGMFLFRASVYLDALTRFAPRIAASCARAADEVVPDRGFLHLGEAFAASPSDSVDYAVMERTDRAAVVPLDAGWSDVGSWTALWEVSEQDAQGNAHAGDVLLQDTHDTYVRAGHRLVVALGLRDTVIVETADAVLVASRDAAQRVKDVVASLRDAGRPEVDLHREVERPWGRFEVLHHTGDVAVKRLVVRPGQSLSLQRHARRTEHWVVVRGTLEVRIGDTTRALGVGESVDVPVAAPHRIANPGAEEAELVEVQIGTVDEGDVVRISDRYGRAGETD